MALKTALSNQTVFAGRITNQSFSLSLFTSEQDLDLLRLNLDGPNRHEKVFFKPLVDMFDDDLEEDGQKRHDTGR